MFSRLLEMDSSIESPLISSGSHQGPSLRHRCVVKIIRASPLRSFIASCTYKGYEHPLRRLLTAHLTLHAETWLYSAAGGPATS